MRPHPVINVGTGSQTQILTLVHQVFLTTISLVPHFNSLTFKEKVKCTNSVAKLSYSHLYINAAVTHSNLHTHTKVVVKQNRIF